MTYMPLIAEMPNGEVHRGMRRVVVGAGIAANMSSGTLMLTGIAAPAPEVTASFTHRVTFTAVDLLDGVLVVAHGMNENCPMVQVWSNLGEVVIPDNIRRINSNTTSIDVSSYGNIEGNWEAILIK